ncbi:MAG: F0F1 ATP synthase subunit delta [Candidatus Portnoybacteria bacterium]|nr:F0F1 ATP synthase subunit delta [Candidatus Portnoybacteria bacterium]
MKYTPFDYAKILYETQNVDVFMEVLRKHWVLPWLPKILERLEMLLRKKEGIVPVQVLSPRPLDKVAREDIVRLIQKEFKGKQLKADFIIDKTLIGGFRVESEEIIVPASLQDSLKNLELTIANSE